MSILLNEVEYIYGKGTAFEKVALYNVTLKIEDGEFIGLIGHTGSGKSTLIQHMNGLLKPVSGGVYYNGQDINEKDFSKKKLRSKVSIVFQYPEQQLFESSVIEDVRFGPKNIGMESLEVDMNAFEALKQVGIPDELLDVSPLELSGGQKQRTAIARSLIYQPAILLADEPTGNLDRKNSDETLELLQLSNHQYEQTVLLITHDEKIALKADRIITLEDGKIVSDEVTRQ